MQYALIFATAFFWAVAPLIGRVSGIGGLPMGLAVAGGSLLATLPILLMRGSHEALVSKGGLVAASAGVVNGLGLITFYLLLAGAADGRWELSKSLPIAYALVPVGIALGAWYYFGESLTLEKCIGLGLIATAFWFLK